MAELKCKLDVELDRIYDYVANVFIKQERILKFDEIYGDGTIWKPLSKYGAKVFYNEILKGWREYETDKCGNCNGTGMIKLYEDEFKCGICDLGIEDFLEDE